MNFKEELCSCQHFLVDSELERAKHKVSNYATQNFNAANVEEQLGHFPNKLNRSKSESSLWVHFEKHRWKIQNF